MERQDFLLAAGLFVFAALAGYYAGSGGPEDAGDGSVAVEAEVNSSSDVVEAEFHGESVQLMHEDGTRSTFYLDTDLDGSADITLDTESDGEIGTGTKIVIKNGTGYLLKYRYRDSPDQRGDGWLRIERAESS
jgi:hypothetical protein